MTSTLNIVIEFVLNQNIKILMSRKVLKFCTKLELEEVILEFEVVEEGQKWHQLKNSGL
jgi:hypothetical protein